MNVVKRAPAEDKMSEAKHTPAPWTVEDYGDDETPSLVIHKDSESRICFMATPGSMGDPEKIEADAYLIATAPELLYHAETVLFHLRRGDHVHPRAVDEMIAALEGVIAKAKQQSHSAR